MPSISCRNYRLLSLFRFKIWWMVPQMGKSGRDVPVETQMLLLEAKDEFESSTYYILFLPVLDGNFRSSLQGKSTDELEFCIESGDPAVEASEFYEAVFVNFGSNPFELMKESMKNQYPGSLDWFGWCTWDAFYHAVNPQGIKEGLKSLSEGGTPARFLIIDDGWQRYVYLWHALMGYWGGLNPNAPGTNKYNAKLLYPVQSPGNLSHIRDLAMDRMEIYGVGTISPSKIFEFYDDLHSYLVSQNVDGVKVDVQNLMETLGTGFGGRVSFTRQFQLALERSVNKNFQDNSIICCMGHNTDSIYSSNVSAITRASDDYYPKNQASQTLHIATVAFNSIFLGEIVVPDWDMFYSDHYAAEFHAAARALGGCGVYVSDKPGKHDFKLLKRLVLPNGSVLRAKYPGRPTRDCLFNDPVIDGKSLLKIWNMNTYSGVLGVFNCQGAGTWPCLDNVENDSDVKPSKLTGSVSPSNIECLEEVAGNNWTGDCAVFSFNSGGEKIQFAPIGLINMYNSGGAVEAVEFVINDSNCQLKIKGSGSGNFGAYSSANPKFCMVNSKEEEFEYKVDEKFLTITVPHGNDSWEIDVAFMA
ncbi:putative galactinol--sucrose galactosyltransferase 2 [Acorus gramineus]|uniref:galactinol--sucrose galactosyltransferase n=1 Tax=Acorus gramineus TaxID=55184 RepID=A0AAV9B9K5_ACOGR|nr:putative galactinol--sucrose galactosyltransferase 2 [Acorus gramineus]